jgi:hypothetical protein
MSFPSVVVVTPPRGQAVVMFDLNALNFFVSITAANIIDQVSHMPNNKGEGTRPRSGSGKLLSDKVNWADHGYLNALQSQVEFLYSWVGEAIRDYMSAGLYLMTRGQVELIAEALSSYQVYKTKVIEWQKTEDGELVGANTQFVKMDWTDQNNKLLSLMNLMNS